MAKQTFTTGQVLTAAQMTSLQQTAMGGGSTTAKTTSYVLVAADAGTVVQMNAAGATTITVNTALFAAGDTVQIQNIGAGVCTVTAGTATVTTAGSLALSQWEGGQLYFTATSSAIFFDIVQSSGMTNPLTTTGDTIYSSSGTTAARLGIGSTNQALGVTGGIPAWQASSKSTLTTTGDVMYASAANTPAALAIGTTGQILTVASGLPSWATAASGGGFDLITTIDASAATTVSFTSIAGTYDHLLLIWQGVYMSAATQYLDVKYNSSATGYSFMGIDQAPTPTGFYSGATSSIGGGAEYAPVPFTPASNIVEDNGRGQMWIYNYASSSISKRFQYSGQATSAGSLATTRGMVNGNGLWNNTAAITQVDFIRSGAATITGKFQLWGVK